MLCFPDYPPPFWVEIIPDPVPLALLDASCAPDHCTRVRHLPLFEICVDPLDRRYEKACFINTRFGPVRVREEPRVPPKDAVLVRKLMALIDHPSTGKDERENAKRRVQQIGQRVRMDAETEFLSIDRKQLFVDNMEVLANGLVAICKTIKDRIFVYAGNNDEMEEWMDVAQYAADNYVKIPRRLAA